MWRITKLTGVLSALAIVASCGGGADTSPPPPALSIVTAALSGGFVMFAYSQTVQSSGGVGPFTWALSLGNLPHNLAVGNSSTSSVTISGTPDIAQPAATFTIRVTDAKSQSTTKSFSISISNVAESPIAGSSGAGSDRYG
jgi:large repetitive protein